MMKNFGKLFRRKSITEQELQKDYPTNNSDSDDDNDEDTRWRAWQKNLNRRESDRMDDFSDIMEDEHWEYESDYDYSIQSESTVIDAYKERRYPDYPKLYSDRDLEHRIEQAMRNEITDREEQKLPRRQGDDKKDRFRSLSPVNETVRKFEQSLRTRRSSGAAHPQHCRSDRKGSSDSNGKNSSAYNKKKQRKQHKQRRRAKDVNLDLSDEGDGTKYAVNLTMDDLNDLIQKNITSAVKSIVSKSKSQRAISPSESFSTETETIFSGSSSHSTDIPTGLLAKQIKTQLDTDKLKGIIKKTVAKETNDALQMSLNAQNRVSIAPTLPDFQHNAHLNAYVTHAQMMPDSPHITSHIPQAPPPPPAMVPSHIPHVMVTLPDGNTTHHNLSNRRHSLAPNLKNNSIYNQDNYQNISLIQRNPPASPFMDDAVLPPGTTERLRNRRHTLAALGSTSDLSAIGDGLDNKIEQFGIALKLLDKKIQQADDSKKSENDKSSEYKSEHKPPVQKVTAYASDSNLDDIATITGGVNGPVLSVADQIKALSKKKEKKPLGPGELEMSSFARTFLILSNMIFLMSGSGVVALGVWLMMDPNIETYFDIINLDQNGSGFKMICYGLIAVGVFALSVAFLGCCGAVQRSKCMITMFLATIGALTLLEAGLGAMLMMNKNSPTAVPVLSSVLSDVEDYLKTQLKKSLVSTYIPDTMMGSTWDLVQMHLECCGATGAEDYDFSKWKNDTRPETDFPDTCCVLIDKHAVNPEPSNKLLCHFGTAGFYFETGCFEKMIGWFKDNSTYIVIAAIIVIAIEVIAFVSAFLICRKAVKAAKRKKEAKLDTTNKHVQKI